MRKRNRRQRVRTLFTTALLAAVAFAPVGGAASAAPSRVNGVRTATIGKPTETTTLSIGEGQMIALPAAMTDLFVADDKVADVQVRSASQLYLFGKGAGETAVYATDKSGKVIWSSIVRVGSNITSVDTMLKLAMPEAAITATTMNGIVLLTGTVAAPSDIEEAQKLVEQFTGKDVQVVNRLRSAVPLQVNLQVKIAEVSREFAKSVGVNLLNRDTTGGFLFGIAQGRNFGTIGNADYSAFPKIDASGRLPVPAGTMLPYNVATDQFLLPPGTQYDLKNLGQGKGTSLALMGKIFGLDLAAAIDLAEADGLVTTLAQPNLTAISGETASFLAGGEIPIPLAQGLGAVSVEFKQYGVSLSFTPTVLSDGRISIRVRPEVSQLTDAGSVKLNGFTIPGITTRRAETTVELGSGQAFMIGGLLSNGQNSNVDKAPFLADLPVLGALFRSNGFKRNETELMIVVTPYLVKPVSPQQIALPTAGLKSATDAERLIAGQTFMGKSGEQSPTPVPAPPKTVPAGDRVSKAAPAKGKGAVPDAGFALN
ncbi:type II and III secretion system protein family protein [Rhizorhabdus dicambivorans]|uniref:Secretion system protein n=1 Tax=Rhizorhabdus dicambivorans TaxID=1850238 RepID=A0A2A4G2V4_9SPHN|nr:type II and III secretion system protein family protein [Rhizorhabdus dicambivorans]ATE64856.1 secretion system protein [Rhizorhabdus dicambivorans]PCE44130.1 secretion system protein [Rhizorhabdus dicambivorans]